MNANLRNILKLVIGSIGFLGMLVALQAVLSQFNQRIDLTLQKKFTLSSRTQRVISNLTQDVQATAFIHPDRPENYFLDDMLSRMKSLSPHFSYTIVDMNRSPAVARQYDARQYGTIFFESEGRRRKSSLNAGENDTVAALLYVVRKKEKIVYFLTGHGEGDLSDPQPEDGYTKLRGALADEFYTAKTLSLADTGRVPEDAKIVVLLGPKASLLPFELDALDAYLKRGGAVFVLIEPNGSPTLVDFLEKRGISLPPFIAVDPSKRIYAGELVTFRASRTSITHDMIKSVNAPPIFSFARVIEVRQNLEKGITAAPILATSGSGWGTAEQEIAPGEYIAFVQGRDMSGPVSVAGEVFLSNGEGENPGRILVFGDVDLINNSLLEQGGNRDLFVNAANWLAEDEWQIGQRQAKQAPGVKQFFLGAEDGQRILIVSTVVMPSSFLLLGIGIFVWRRQRG